MLDLRDTGLLFGFFLLLTVQLLVACEFFGMSLKCRIALRGVLFSLAFLHQALLFLLLLAGLLGLLFIDQPGFEQLIAKGKTHVSARLVVNSN